MATTGEASWVRLALVGSRSFAVGRDGGVTPSFAVGLQQEGGDGATGMGVELGTALQYDAPGLALSARLRG